MEKFKIYCEIIVSQPVVTRALKVSLVVGTTLNLINQGENLLLFHLEHLNILKLTLTYIVPYTVTTYTATTMNLEFKIGSKAIVSAKLKCKKCGKRIEIQKEELIPECPKCGIHTEWRLA